MTQKKQPNMDSLKKLKIDMFLIAFPIFLSIGIEVISDNTDWGNYKYYSIFLIFFIAFYKFTYDLWGMIVHMINSQEKNIISIETNNEDMISLQEKNMIKIENNHGELLKLNEKIAPRSKLINIMEDLYNQSDILIATGQKSIDSIIENVNVQPSSINLKGEMLSLLGYEYFWGKLIELQEIRYKKEEDGLVAIITHSNPIHIWDSEWSSKMLEEQANFIDNGGEVYRILIDY